MKSGEQLANEGMQQSLLNADLDWRMHAETVINKLITNARTFTSDDVLIELEKQGARSVNNSALGGVIKKFAREDKIEHFGWQPSKRPSRHKAPVKVWRSKVFETKYI